jgi:superfamily II DNA or RNA helicase
MVAARRTVPPHHHRPRARVAPKAPPPELRPFQREGVDFLAENGWRVLLADAPGCGKTPQVLVAMRENVRTLCPMLVVCPSSVAWNWRREALRWVPGVKVHVVEGFSGPLPRGVHLTICPWDVLAARLPDLVTRGFKTIVADEAHYAKAGEETQRGRALQTLCATVPHILFLSGTPLVNHADELDTLRGMFGEKPPAMLRRLLENVATDIPPKRRVTLKTTIPDDIRVEYDKAKEEFGDWLDDYLPRVLDDAAAAETAASKALAAEPLAKVAYLRRILGRGKVPGTAAWVASMVKRSEPVVVFGMFTDVLDLLGQALSRLAIPFVRLDGTHSRQQRQVAIDAFQAGKVPVFVGSMAAKEGITLTKARHLLFMERWYTPAAEEQAEDRIRRIGQTRPTTMWYLHADDTIDERISEIVDAKRGIVAANIGTATIEHLDAPTVMDAWERMRTLKDGVPTVAANPTASLPLPKLPDPRIIHAVIFDATRWPIPDVQRALRAAGYRQRGLDRKGNTVRIEIRAKGAFVPGTLRTARLASDFGMVAGKPAPTRAARAASYRALAKKKAQAAQRRMASSPLLRRAR